MDLLQESATPQILDAAIHRRFITDFAHEEEITVQGKNSEESKPMIQKALELKDTLKEENKDWLDKKKESLKDYFEGLNEDYLESGFEKGLELIIKQEYRLTKKVSPEEVDKLLDTEYLQNLIQGYFFNYYRSIQICKRMGVPPTVATDIARLSYYHAPQEIIALRNKFPNIRFNFIQRALTSTPSDPEGYLTTLRENYDLLSKKYPDIPGHMVMDICAKHAEPEKSLLEARQLVTDLSQEFPTVPAFALQYTVVAFGVDARAALQKILYQSDELKKKFPDLPENLIFKASLKNPRKPEKFLEELSLDIRTAIEKYPELPERMITEVVFRNRQSPDKALQRAVIDLEQLYPKFPDIARSIINGLYAGHPNEAQTYIQARVDLYNQLREQFPQMSIDLLRRTAFSNLKLDADVIQQKESQIKEMYERFSDVPRTLVTEIAITHTNPASRLEKIRAVYPQLKSQFPSANGLLLNKAVIQHAENPQAYIESILEQVGKYKGLFPHIPKSEILKALVDSPLSLEKKINQLNIDYQNSSPIDFALNDDDSGSFTVQDFDEFEE